MEKNGHLDLSCGVAIELTELRQKRTYIDVIEGVPCRSVNNVWLAELRAGSRAATTPTYLVPPPQQQRWQHEDPDKGWFLPDKKCFAVFRGPSTHGGHDDITELEVVFFQEEWAMPIDASVLTHIRGIDSFEHALESGWT